MYVDGYWGFSYMYMVRCGTSKGENPLLVYCFHTPARVGRFGSMYTLRLDTVVQARINERTRGISCEIKFLYR